MSRKYLIWVALAAVLSCTLSTYQQYPNSTKVNPNLVSIHIHHDPFITFYTPKCKKLVTLAPTSVQKALSLRSSGWPGGTVCFV